jgi:hypothetical protein
MQPVRALCKWRRAQPLHALHTRSLIINSNLRLPNSVSNGHDYRQSLSYLRPTFCRFLSTDVASAAELKKMNKDSHNKYHKLYEYIEKRINSQKCSLAALNQIEMRLSTVTITPRLLAAACNCLRFLSKNDAKKAGSFV